MALKASIFKAKLNVADLNNDRYQDFSLTLARHPSETDERMMVRLLAFALNADDLLSFGKGLSTDDEPDLWRKSLTDEIELWVDVGQPSLDRIRKACQRSLQVNLYVYGHDKNIGPWWQKLESELQRFKKLQVWQLPFDITQSMAAMAKVNMDLQCTVDGGDIYLSDATDNLHLQPQLIFAGEDRADG